MGIIDDALEPQKRLIAGLGGNTKPQPAPKPATAPKAPTGPEYEPLAVQPDEHSDYMGKQLEKISSRINTKGQEAMKAKLLKTSSKSSSKR